MVYSVYRLTREKASKSNLILPPHHLIDHTRVALDDLHDLIAHVLIHVIRHGNAEIAVSVHLHSHIHRLQQPFLVDAGEDEASLTGLLIAPRIQFHL